MQEIFNTIIRMSFQGTVIFLIIFLLRLALKKLRISHGYMVGLWLILFFFLVFPWKVSVPMGFWQHGALPMQYADSGMPIRAGEESLRTEEDLDAIDTADTDKDTGFTATVENAAEPNKEGVSDTIDTAALTATTRFLVKLWSFLPFLWAAGLVVLVCHLAASYIMIRRRLMISIRYRDNVYWTEGIDTPMVFGLLRPRIYLPVYMQQEILDYVLLHEQMHIRRGDMLWKEIAYGICLLHWFNPFAWLAFYLLGDDMEKACDEQVIRRLGEERKDEYAHALLQVASVSFRGERKVFVAPICFDEGDIKDRIKNIMDYKYTLPIAGGAVILLAAVLVMAFMTTSEGENLLAKVFFAGRIEAPVVPEVVVEEEEEIVVAPDETEYDSTLYGGAEWTKPRKILASDVMDLAQIGTKLTFGDFLAYELSLDNTEDIPHNAKRYSFRERGVWFQIIIVWEDGVEPEIDTPLISAVISAIEDTSVSADLLRHNPRSVLRHDFTSKGD